MQRITFIGPPASGKGTQAEALGASLGVPVLSTGRLLRREEQLGTELGRLSLERSKTGSFVPDAAVLELVIAELPPPGRGFVLDGFPRTDVQAEALDAILAERGERLDAAVLLEVPEDELRRRSGGRLVCTECGRVDSADGQQEGDRCPECGGAVARRVDDAGSVFEKRLERYRALTLPVADRYRADGRLRVVDGAGSPDEVYRRVREGLGTSGSGRDET